MQVNAKSDCNIYYGKRFHQEINPINTDETTENTRVLTSKTENSQNRLKTESLKESTKNHKEKNSTNSYKEPQLTNNDKKNAKAERSYAVKKANISKKRTDVKTKAEKAGSRQKCRCVRPPPADRTVVLSAKHLWRNVARCSTERACLVSRHHAFLIVMQCMAKRTIDMNNGNGNCKFI